jgi:hypothetical protein
MIGLAQGLGQGIADVGKMAYSAQIEEQRTARLRQYAKEDYAQQRADGKSDQAELRAQTVADRDDDRLFRTEAEERIYQRTRTDSAEDYTRNRSDTVSDRARAEGRADAAAKMAATLSANKWGNIKEVKGKDELGNETVTGFIATLNGQVKMIDVGTGTIQDFRGIESLVGMELPSAAPTADQPSAAMPAPAEQPAAQQQAAPAQSNQPWQWSEEDSQRLAQERQQKTATAQSYVPVSQRGPPPAPALEPRAWQGGGGSGLLSYPAFQ